MAELWGSNRSSTTITAKIPAKGAMPQRNVSIFSPNRVIIAAKLRITPSFATSEGWNEMPRLTHRVAPFSDLPIPGTNTRIRNRTDVPSTGNAIFRISSGRTRLTASIAAVPTSAKIPWRLK